MSNDARLEFFKALSAVLLKRLGSHLILSKHEYANSGAGTFMHRYHPNGDLEIKIIDKETVK